MFILDCLISIESKSLAKSIHTDYVHEVQIKTSVNDLTDTAVLKIPKKMQWKGKNIADFIRPDDDIAIRLGYQKEGLHLVFQGSIASIDNKNLLTVRCENAMRRLKKIMVSPQTISQFDPRTFAPLLSAGITIDMPEQVSFGSLDIQSPMSLAAVLDAVKQKYPYVKPFFSLSADGKPVLHIINRIMPRAGMNPIKCRIGHNTVQDSLKFTPKEDVKVAIKAVHISKQNRKIEVTVPQNTDGRQMRTFHVTECSTEPQLRAWAESMLQKYTEDKTDGTLTLLGIPLVRKTDIVRILDQERPEMNNHDFFVTEVSYQFSQSGYRQVITLGDRLKFNNPSIDI